MWLLNFLNATFTFYCYCETSFSGKLLTSHLLSPLRSKWKMPVNVLVTDERRECTWMHSLETEQNPCFGGEHLEKQSNRWRKRKAAWIDHMVWSYLFLKYQMPTNVIITRVFGFNVQGMPSFCSYHSYFYSVSAHCQNMLVSIIASAFGSGNSWFDTFKSQLHQFTVCSAVYSINRSLEFKRLHWCGKHFPS